MDGTELSGISLAVLLLQSAIPKTHEVKIQNFSIGQRDVVQFRSEQGRVILTEDHALLVSGGTQVRQSYSEPYWVDYAVETLLPGVSPVDVDGVIEFYEKVTGEKLTHLQQRRKEKIRAALWEWGLSLAEVSLELHPSPQWAKAECRSPLEQLSKRVGSTDQHGRATIVWLVPLVEPR